MNDETNETKNRQLHELLGRHWHEWKQVNEPGVLMFYRCECGEERWPAGDSLNPDYCSDLNLCAEAEKEVVAKVGVAKYGYHLTFIVGAQYTSSANEVAGLAATATAEHRVTAMIEVLTEK